MLSVYVHFAPYQNHAADWFTRYFRVCNGSFVTSLAGHGQNKSCKNERDSLKQMHSLRIRCGIPNLHIAAYK